MDYCHSSDASQHISVHLLRSLLGMARIGMQFLPSQNIEPLIEK